MTLTTNIKLVAVQQCEQCGGEGYVRSRPHATDEMCRHCLGDGQIRRELTIAELQELLTREVTS